MNRERQGVAVAVVVVAGRALSFSLHVLSHDCAIGWIIRLGLDVVAYVAAYRYRRDHLNHV